MTTEDWINECRRKALAEGDRSRQRLHDLHYRAWDFRETDPAQALALYDEGSRLAQQLNDPWWRLFYDNWRVNTLLFWMHDFRRGLDLAVKNELDVRHTTFAQFPGRFSTHFNLVDAYIGVDPEGYRERIDEALNYLEREIPREGQPVYRLLKSWCSFALGTLQLDLVQQKAVALLNQADRDFNRYNAAFHCTFAYGQLTLQAYERRDWEATTEWVRLGCATANSSQSEGAQSEFILWEALLTRQRGEEDEAQKIKRRAVTRMNRLASPPGRNFRDALCGFHELGGEWDKILRVRRLELQDLINTGLLDAECRCRVRICHLLAKLGQPLADELAQARRATESLKKPQRYLAELDALAQGEAS